MLRRIAMLVPKMKVVKYLSLNPLVVTQMQGLVEPLREPPKHRYMGLRQAENRVERSNEAMMKITYSIDANTKSMENQIVGFGRNLSSLLLSAVGVRKIQKYCWD